MSTEHEVICPLPGTFYRRPAPDAAPYREEGDEVREGEVIGLVEVMKQFSEITADCSGRILRFLAESEAPVEPGQVLAIIEKP